MYGKGTCGTLIAKERHKCSKRGCIGWSNRYMNLIKVKDINVYTPFSV
jgi:hypothetical protein